MTEKVLLRKSQEGGFYPATEHDAEELRGIPVGGYVRCNPKQPRHPEHHKKCFAMLHMIYDNLPEHIAKAMPTFEKFYRYMKVASGAVEETINHKGDVFYVVKSLSFAELDQLEFQRVYESFIDVARDRLGMEWVEEFA